MNRLFQTLLLSLLASRCAVRADDVGTDFDPEDGEAWELAYGYYPYQSYQTTNLISPAFRKVVDSPQCYDDLYTFFTPRGYSIEAPGPMIVDNDGELVWSKSTEGQAYDLVVHEIDGEQFLTYWIGDDRVRGHGQGDYYMLNSSYHQVAKISALGGMQADLHEMVITPEGTALVTVYQVYEHDLTEFRDFAGEPTFIWDCLFQEIDLKTNELVFQWRASEHHAVNETFRDLGFDGSEDAPWDWFHINSIQKDELGNFLISARYTHTLTYINGSSGDIIWVLGGKRNAFEDLSEGAATKFAWQHQARIMPLDTFPVLLADRIQELGLQEGQKDKDGMTTQLVTIFDNSAEDQHYSDVLSHGLLLEISYPSVAPPERNTIHRQTSGDNSKRWEEPATESYNNAYTVRLVHSYDHPQNIISSSQGSFQVIPSNEKSQDPKVMLGYGFNAVFTEFAATGEVLCDTHFATNYSWERGDVQSYRAFKFPWVGHPLDPPTASLGDDAMFVSWNGATEVRKWVLQHSSQFSMKKDAAWETIAEVEKHGFETEIEFEEDEAKRYLRVLALDANGKILGMSRGVDLGWTAGLTSALPKLVDSNLTPLKLLMLFACNITALFLLYECYRKFFIWRRHRQWRHYKSIRLNSDA